MGSQPHLPPEQKTVQSSFFTSQHGVAELIHMPELAHRWKTLETTRDFIIDFLAFPRAKGPHTALLLLAPCSPCCLDPVRSC